MNKKVDPGWSHFAKYTFSPGIERDGWLYISGATASVENGEIVCPGDICGQTDYILDRMSEILEAADCSYDDVVKTTDFITTTDGYQGTGAVRKKDFKEPYPAATGVIVADLLRPGALIEIEAIAKIPEK